MASSSSLFWSSITRDFPFEATNFAGASQASFDVLFPKVHGITDSGLKLLRDQEPADLFSTLSDNEKKRCLTTQYTEKFECRN